jgi:hypothetical protein
MLLDPREVRAAVDDEILGVHGGLTSTSGPVWCERDGRLAAAALTRVKAHCCRPDLGNEAL